MSQSNKARANNPASIPKYKIVFVGEEAVGKTSIINKYVHDEFAYSYESTIGVDFLTKIQYTANQSQVKFQIWDTAGQERFRSLIPSYIRNTHVAIICYDISNSGSFDKLDYWIQKIKEYSTNSNEILQVLVGNKIDLELERQVTLDDLKQKAEANEIQLYFEVSAKSGQSIPKLFKSIADHVPEHRETLKASLVYRSFIYSYILCFLCHNLSCIIDNQNKKKYRNSC